MFGKRLQNGHKAKANLLPWMSKAEVAEAIPPAYTEYIGKYLIKAI